MPTNKSSSSKNTTPGAKASKAPVAVKRAILKARHAKVAAAMRGTKKLCVATKVKPGSSLSNTEAVELAKRAGILTSAGKLADFYR